MYDMNVGRKRGVMYCIRDSVSFILYLFMAWKERSGTVTLVYHSVDRVDPAKDPYRLNISPEMFEEHLKVISRYKDSVRITFDDGYGNNFKNAFPLLKKYGLTATVFLVTDYIDCKIAPNKLCGDELALKPLTWDEIVTMYNSGITFGSHTKTHPVLAALSCDAIREELYCSKKRIEESLGHMIDSLAYPFGGRSSYNAMVTKITAEAGYKYAYTNIMGIHKEQDKDDLCLRRVRIYTEDGPLKLRMKLKGAYDWVDSL